MIKFKDKDNNDTDNFLRVTIISPVTYELITLLDKNNVDIGAVFNYKDLNKYIKEHDCIMDELRYYMCNRMNQLINYKDIDRIQNITRINCLGIDDTYFLYIGGYYYLTNDINFIQKYIKR